MIVKARPVQISRGMEHGLRQRFGDPSGKCYYYYLPLTCECPQAPQAPPCDQEEAEEDELSSFSIIQALEASGHFAYLEGEEEDIYTLDDGQPVG